MLEFKTLNYSNGWISLYCDGVEIAVFYNPDLEKEAIKAFFSCLKEGSCKNTAEEICNLTKAMRDEANKRAREERKKKKEAMDNARMKRTVKDRRPKK